MKLFGSIKELISAVFRKDSQEITVRPNQSTTYTAARDIQLPPGDAAHVLTSANSTQTLSNKTIAAGSNTISGLANANIDAAAAIDATKIGNGDVDNTELSKLNGLSGNITTNSNSQTLTNKTIDGDDNTVQDLAITSLKTVLGDANKVLRRDASGVPQSGNTIPNTSALVTTDATQTLSNKTLDSSNSIVNPAALEVIDNVFVVKDNGDTTKQFKFDAAAISPSTSRTLSIPNASGDVVLNSATQTLTNKTIDGNNNTLTVLAATQLSGATPIANGGTGQTSKTNAFDALSPTTTKGDLIVSDGSDNIRLGVGSNNQVLVADSAQTSGVKWANVSATPPTLGDTSGSAIPAGYLGEIIGGGGSAGGVTTGSDLSGAITLTTGVWLINGVGIFNGTAGAADTSLAWKIKNTTDNTSGLGTVSSGTPAGLRNAITLLSRVVVIASGDADKTVRMRATSSASQSVDGYIQAVRIG